MFQIVRRFVNASCLILDHQSNLRNLIVRIFPLLCVHVFAHSRDRLGPIAPLEEYSEVNDLTIVGSSSTMKSAHR